MNKINQMEIIKELNIRKARNCFLTFRMLINPRLKIGWFVLGLKILII